MRQCVAVNCCRDTSYEHGFVCGACLVADISEHWGAAVCQGFLGIAGAVQGPVNACTSMWAANEAWPASSKGKFKGQGFRACNLHCLALAQQILLLQRKVT